jgi:hypothetical protein
MFREIVGRVIRGDPVWNRVFNCHRLNATCNPSLLDRPADRRRLTAKANRTARYVNTASFVWLINHQPTVLFSQNKPATSNQPAVFFSQNKSAPAIDHQPNEQVARLDRGMTHMPDGVIQICNQNVMQPKCLYTDLQNTNHHLWARF